MTQNSDNDPLSTGGAFGVLADLKDGSDDPLAGRTLGAYEIISIIAAGGMGRVYRARRADGSLDREVAVKVSATSSLSDELRSRFAQEQNVLAGLNHPNICQLYDAEVSEDGWPYIVMELVDGDSIVEYCHKNELSVRHRLRLLARVVDAVAYAHSQLVVHRDIKPANVLVNSNDEVKLLDFGIAKLLEPDAKLTQGAPLTPRYASPEQLLGQPITVASDIAQLGLLIYEVLNGEPLNPSETLADAIQRAADGRSLRVKLDKARELPREVLPIIEHCLRADPRDRYPDANSLKADLEAYLDGYPVTAVGQSTGYRVRKFVGRNLATTALTGVLIAVLVGGGVSYTMSIAAARLTAVQERDEADRQRSIADESLNFVTSILNQADPNIAQGEDISVREAVDASIERIAEEYEDRPEVQTRIYLKLTQLYYSLGDIEKNAELALAAETASRKAYGEQSEEYLRARHLVGSALIYQGKYDEANAHFTDLLPQTNATFGPMSNESFKIKSALAVTYYYLGNLAEFGAINERLLEEVRVTLGEEHQTTLDTAYNVIIVMINDGRYEEAIEVSSKYAAVAEKRLGPGHQTTMRLVHILGNAYGYSGNLAEELKIRQDIMARVRNTFGESHREVAIAKTGLAVVYEELGRYAEAEPLLASAAAINEETFGPQHPEALSARVNLSVFRARYELREGARRDVDDIIATMTELLGAEHQITAQARMYRAELSLLKNVPGENQFAKNELAVAERVLGTDHPELARVLDSIAEIEANREAENNRPELE